MPTEISGSTGVNKIQDGAVQSSDLASGVGGSLIKLQSQTASSSSSIIFSSTYITTTYKRYELHWHDVTISSDGGNITGRVSADNGSSYVTSNYNFIRQFDNTTMSNNTIASSGSTSNTNLLMGGTGDGIGTAANEAAAGTLIMINPFSSDSKLFLTESLHINNNGNVQQNKTYQALIQSATYNNFKIAPNTGTINSGTFTLYGVIT